MITSCALSSPTSAAIWWKYRDLFWACITHFGIPVVPDVELTIQNSSGPNRTAARARGSAAAGSAPSTSTGAARVALEPRHYHVVPDPGQRRRDRAHREAAVFLMRDQRDRPGLADDVAQLPFPGPRADADRDDTRLLAGQQRDMHARRVRQLDRDPFPAVDAERQQRAPEPVRAGIVAAPGQRAVGGDVCGLWAPARCVASHVIGERRQRPTSRGAGTPRPARRRCRPGTLSGDPRAIS